jgi:four helix bundle suffix protein
VNEESLIPKHGGYRHLKSFQVAQLVYDMTVRFCDRYVERRSRTHDQMVQAARSGVQNIAEGSQASGTSKKTELKLTNVARASLEELRLDYEDFLRQRWLSVWEREDPRRAHLIARRCTSADEVARWVKEVGSGACGQHGLSGRDGQGQPGGPENLNELGKPENPYEQGKPGNLHGSDKPGGVPVVAPYLQSTQSIPSTLSTKSLSLHYSEIAANAALVLIAVACSLLDRQIASQARSFESEGGFTERLYRVRSNHRRTKP